MRSRSALGRGGRDHVHERIIGHTRVVLQPSPPHPPSPRHISFRFEGQFLADLRVSVNVHDAMLAFGF